MLKQQDFTWETPETDLDTDRSSMNKPVFKLNFITQIP